MRRMWLKDFMREERLPPAFAGEVDRLHTPLARAIVAAAGRAAGCCIVGLCGPQGSGKSTTVAVLRQLIEDEGLRAGVLSIDDLYLTRAEREALARDVHPLLLTRGPPGTHDVALGADLLGAIKRREPVRLPRFDKGNDDRRAESEWPSVGPLDVLLFEGWCIGARPERLHALEAPLNPLERNEDADGRWRRHVNEALAETYAVLWESIDALVMLEAPNWEIVACWREEQEAKLREAMPDGARVMSHAEIARFVQFYERTSRHIAAEMPARADLVITLDEIRRPSAIRVRPVGALSLG